MQTKVHYVAQLPASDEVQKRSFWHGDLAIRTPWEVRLHCGQYIELWLLEPWEAVLKAWERYAWENETPPATTPEELVRSTFSLFPSRPYQIGPTFPLPAYQLIPRLPYGVQEVPAERSVVVCRRLLPLWEYWKQMPSYRMEYVRAPDGSYAWIRMWHLDDYEEKRWKRLIDFLEEHVPVLWEPMCYYGLSEAFWHWLTPEERERMPYEIYYKGKPVPARPPTSTEMLSLWLFCLQAYAEKCFADYEEENYYGVYGDYLFCKETPATREPCREEERRIGEEFGKTWSDESSRRLQWPAPVWYRFALAEDWNEPKAFLKTFLAEASKKTGSALFGVCRVGSEPAFFQEEKEFLRYCRGGLRLLGLPA